MPVRLRCYSLCYQCQWTTSPIHWKSDSLVWHEWPEQLIARFGTNLKHCGVHYISLFDYHLFDGVNAIYEIVWAAFTTHWLLELFRHPVPPWSYDLICYHSFPYSSLVLLSCTLDSLLFDFKLQLLCSINLASNARLFLMVQSLSEAVDIRIHTSM